MVYLNGRDRPSFRCECGCNVFHAERLGVKRPKRICTCNACGVEYEGVTDE